MKSILPTFLLLAIFFQFTSCTRTFYFLAGGRQPQIESQKSLQPYYPEGDKIYVLKDKEALIHFYSLKMTIPMMYFFDKSKKQILFDPTAKTCNASIDSLILMLGTMDETPLMFSTSIDKIMEGVVDINTQKSPILEPDMDYYLVSYWCKYMGKSIYKKHNKIWDDAIDKMKTKGMKIQSIKINIDYQTNWNVPKDSIPKINFK